MVDDIIHLFNYDIIKLIKEKLESIWLDLHHAWPATCPPFCVISCFFWGQNPISKKFPTSINRGCHYSQKLENLAKLWPNFSSPKAELVRKERKENFQTLECLEPSGERFSCWRASQEV